MQPESIRGFSRKVSRPKLAMSVAMVALPMSSLLGCASSPTDADSFRRDYASAMHALFDRTLTTRAALEPDEFTPP
ncbi:MAG: hypothetical protein QOG09_1818, partial [Solirubrobacterales bacterium]|nr:hypothetical protein [Solirubrobacterales bacterium]